MTVHSCWCCSRWRRYWRTNTTLSLASTRFS